MASSAAKIKKIERLFQQFFDTIGPTNNNEETDIEHSPLRIARMYVNELLSGYDSKELEDLTRKFTVFNRTKKHEMVVVKDTWFLSLCAHHMMPFFGHVHFGYIPNEKVVGLSKFPRVVRHFSARLQTQEQLTSELADYVWEQAKPASLIVLTKSQHLCCAGRGVRQPSVQMVTSAIRPQTMSESEKVEFYRLIDS